LYQRHHSFVFCGVLVSQLTGIPLIVEYQNSELWRANNWDPCHFRGLLKIAEDLTLRCAHGFVALSTVLRDELVAQGARPERILVNPAAADIAKFFPGCGDGKTRQRLGFLKNDVVVCFLGTFSYYHGVTVLQKAIAELLQKRQENDQTPRLKFLLIGDGVLRPQMAEELNVVKGADAVMFTGSVQHDAIPLMLDAADILVSPHVPLEDGSAFFGSPTKLFEYMAAGKAIVASNMFQIAEVMQHGKTAWLVTPGSHSELAEAIEMLAGNPVIRSLLGANARAAVLDRHLWRHNGERVLSLSRSLTKEG
jgi:glycosyltransferase involved in cell wall biosynthesis